MKDRQHGTFNPGENRMYFKAIPRRYCNPNKSGNTKYVGYDPNVVSISTKQSWQMDLKMGTLTLPQ